jgi:hypothetical protein
VRHLRDRSLVRGVRILSTRYGQCATSATVRQRVASGFASGFASGLPVVKGVTAPARRTGSPMFVPSDQGRQAGRAGLHNGYSANIGRDRSDTLIRDRGRQDDQGSGRQGRQAGQAGRHRQGAHPSAREDEDGSIGHSSLG